MKYCGHGPGRLLLNTNLDSCAQTQGSIIPMLRAQGMQTEEWVLLLPAEPDRSAEQIRAEIESKTGKQTGILIINSHGRAWRNGTVGVAIGIAGLPGLQDLRGQAGSFRIYACGLHKWAWQMNLPQQPPWRWDRLLKAHLLSMCAVSLIHFEKGHSRN